MQQQPLPREIFASLAAAPGQVLVMRHEFTWVPIHWHDYYEFVYVLDGSGTHHCNGTDELLSPGHAMLLGPTDFHGYSCRSGQALRCYNLAVDPQFLEQQLEDQGSVDVAGDGSGSAWTVPDLSAAAPLLDQVWEESTSAAPGATRMIEALLTAVMIIFLRRVRGESPEAPADSDADLRRALFFVEQHFREPLTLSRVAEQAHLSPNHFSERFHAFTGSTFQTYLQQRRLRFARSLLRSSDLRVTEAARAAGFGDASHFARAYRQQFGAPPSADRQSPGRHRPVR